MIDLPPAGGGNRTPDLVVERSACQTTELPPSHKIPSGTPKICPNMSQYVPFFEGSPFCHHEGRRKRWGFLNWCTFRFRSTPSSFFPTQQIGFGAGGRFRTFFDNFHVFYRFCFGGDVTNPGKTKVLSIGRWVVGPWPYGPNDNPIGPYTTPI